MSYLFSLSLCHVNRAAVLSSKIPAAVSHCSLQERPQPIEAGKAPEPEALGPISSATIWRRINNALNGQIRVIGPTFFRSRRRLGEGADGDEDLMYGISGVIEVWNLLR